MHVLSLPPAFALSQDQTLKLDENFNPADHNVLTRSHPIFVCARPRAHTSLTRCYTRLRCIAFTSVAFTNRVLTKNVDRRSLYPTAPRPQTSPKEDKPKIKDAVRKDSAVHVSLSSNSLVKQPGSASAPPHPMASQRAIEASKLPTTIGSFVTLVSEELRRRIIAPSSRRRRRVPLYRLRPRTMSTHSNPKIRIYRVSATIR